MPALLAPERVADDLVLDILLRPDDFRKVLRVVGFLVEEVIRFARLGLRRHDSIELLVMAWIRLVLLLLGEQALSVRVECLVTADSPEPARNLITTLRHPLFFFKALLFEELAQRILLRVPKIVVGRPILLVRAV